MASEYVTLETLADCDSAVYVYNDVLWRRKITNVKVLQKSVDEGATWIDVYTFDTNLTQIIVLENGNIIVQQKSEDLSVDPPAKIYLSTDSGEVFTEVLTLTSGGLQTWSFDSAGEVVYLGEYGKYDASNVYKSTDGGLTWNVIFTHPYPELGDQHIHKIHVDTIDNNIVYVSAGDGITVRGIWFTKDGGSNWGIINTGDYQPTWIENDNKYVYLFGDATGKISRINRKNLISGFYDIEEIYDSKAEKMADLAVISFYAGRIAANGLIFAGGVAYGENSIQNNKDGVLLVSHNNGDSWRVVSWYPRKADVSSGISFISKETSSGKMFLMANNKNEVGKSVIEVINTNSQDIINLFTSSIELKGNITLNK